MAQRLSIVVFAITFLAALSTVSAKQAPKPAHEGASQFKAEESRIFEKNESLALESLYYEWFVSGKYREEGDYKKIILACSKKRAAIADMCVKAGLRKPEEAKKFSTLRTDELKIGKHSIYRSRLIKKDNQLLYTVLSKKFDELKDSKTNSSTNSHSDIVVTEKMSSMPFEESRKLSIQIQNNGKFLENLKNAIKTNDLILNVAKHVLTSIEEYISTNEHYPKFRKFLSAILLNKISLLSALQNNQQEKFNKILDSLDSKELITTEISLESMALMPLSNKVDNLEREILFSKDLLKIEQEKFNTLLNSLDSEESRMTERFFEGLKEVLEENPEVGKFDEKIKDFALHPKLKHTKIRTFLKIDGGDSNYVGSLNCLSLKNEDGSQKYYKHYVIGHTPPKMIDPLLTYAQKNWKTSISWDGKNPEDLLEPLARMFWAQTIALPFARGSESNAKWMLNLVARLQKIDLIFTQDFVFRMPFAMGVDDFVTYFKQNTSIRKKKE